MRGTLGAEGMISFSDIIGGFLTFAFFGLVASAWAVPAILTFWVLFFLGRRLRKGTWPDKRAARRALLIPPGLLLVGVGIFFICLHFDRTEVHGSSSPDGGQRIVVSRRTAFPCNDLCDSSIVVRIAVLDSSNGRCVSAQKLKLLEDSDLRDPVIQWRDKSVIVSDLSDRRDIRIELKRQ